MIELIRCADAEVSSVGETGAMSERVGGMVMGDFPSGENSTRRCAGQFSFPSRQSGLYAARSPGIAGRLCRSPECHLPLKRPTAAHRRGVIALLWRGQRSTLLH